MKIAVISDIHGNLEAFERVLDVLDTHQWDRIICLGDNIGYGPDPEEVMTLVRSRPIQSVLGNHEMVINHPRFRTWFNPKVRQSLDFTENALSGDSIKTIRALPKCLILDNIRFVHGCPEESIFLYLFQLTESNLQKKMAALPENICFIGHTHELGLTVFNPRKKVIEEQGLEKGETQLDPALKYIINAGSVGQPRDDNKDAKLIFFDTRSLVLDVRFIPYNRQVTINKMNQLGLPPSFSEKLI